MFSLFSPVRTGARARAPSAHSAGPGHWVWGELSEVLFRMHLISGADCSGTRSDLGGCRYCLALKAAAEGG